MLVKVHLLLLVFRCRRRVKMRLLAVVFSKFFMAVAPADLRYKEKRGMRTDGMGWKRKSVHPTRKILAVLEIRFDTNLHVLYACNNVQKP
jgi:hypothetical protein